ncbi:GNAT family N-acetyltransferase [Spartinivicinus poritis]|uniref:N-acetyltransferase n=1 Tax=Spartinivicinus poritis TaxID=2994640 RepID=A0ABT5UF95_9GAMM|nr:N-acetyltransferase [Spartinivicinus sp. A2-2]MDE1464865.1 N-acetyltransferase [Spartinivicinus sp. A2-2]
MVTLRPMIQHEFADFLTNEIKGYAEWITHAYKLPPERALATAKEQLSYKYKDGIDTKNQYIFIVENSNQQKIGIVAYSIQIEDQSAWIDVIEIEKAHRQQGYGKHVLDLVETRLKQHDINHIVLHVYKENEIAQSLYKKQGYRVISHIMTKQLNYTFNE